LANVKRGLPATLDTPYRWGSNSKLFVMIGILQLAEQGKVSLDAPLNRYLPEFTIGSPPLDLPESRTWKLEDITLRRMLTHHSGLPNDILAGMITERPFSYRDFVPMLAKMNAQAPAGLRHSYSNLAFSLLGVVIERVSGEDFDTYMKRHVFAPAGMTGASFTLDPELKQRVARPYDAEGKERPIYELSPAPAGALVASTREMGRFATALLRDGQGAQGPLLHPASLHLSYQRQNQDVALDFDQAQGLAWFIDALPRRSFGRSVQHGGAILSDHTAFALLPDAKLAVLVATNSETGGGAVHEILPEAMALALEVKRGKRTLPHSPPPQVQRAGHVDERELDRWVGHYASPIGGTEVTRDGNALAVQIGGRRFLLKQLADGSFGAWVELAGFFDFQPSELATLRVSLASVGGREVVVVHGGGGKRYVGVKFRPTRVSAPWRARVGEYRLVPRRGDYSFLAGIRLSLTPNGQLMAQPLLPKSTGDVPPVSPLREQSPNAVVSEGFGRNLGVRMTAEDPTPEKRYTTLRFAGLEFRKAATPQR
jgi:CubicO group peptidase (beta-lactamase class C family)